MHIFSPPASVFATFVFIHLSPIRLPTNSLFSILQCNLWINQQCCIHSFKFRLTRKRKMARCDHCIVAAAALVTWDTTWPDPETVPKCRLWDKSCVIKFFSLPTWLILKCHRDCSNLGLLVPRVPAISQKTRDTHMPLSSSFERCYSLVLVMDAYIYAHWIGDSINHWEYKNDLRWMFSSSNAHNWTHNFKTRANWRCTYFRPLRTKVEHRKLFCDSDRHFSSLFNRVQMSAIIVFLNTFWLIFCISGIL